MANEDDHWIRSLETCSGKLDLQQILTAVFQASFCIAPKPRASKTLLLRLYLCSHTAFTLYSSHSEHLVLLGARLFLLTSRFCTSCSCCRESSPCSPQGHLIHPFLQGTAQASPFIGSLPLESDIDASPLHAPGSLCKGLQCTYHSLFCDSCLYM